MKLSVTRPTQIAIAYAILGFGYIGILAILVDIGWAGSIFNLWRHVRSAPREFELIALATLAHFLVSGIAYTWSRTALRTEGVVIAITFFVISCISAFQVAVLWHRQLLPDTVSPASGLSSRFVGAAFYGWLALQFLRYATTATGAERQSSVVRAL